MSTVLLLVASSLGVLNEPVHGGVILLGDVLVHDHHRGSDDLVGLALLVVRAQSGPLAQLLSVGDAEQVRSVLGAQGLYQLDVVAVVARLGQDAKESLASIQDAARLAQTAVQRVGEQSLLQRLFDGVIQIESLRNRPSVKRDKKKKKKNAVKGTFSTGSSSFSSAATTGVVSTSGFTSVSVSILLRVPRCKKQERENRTLCDTRDTRPHAITPRASRRPWLARDQ